MIPAHGFDGVALEFLAARAARPDGRRAAGSCRTSGPTFGDCVDEYRGTEAERLKVMEEHKDRWGREWIMISNPAYGSFESAPFNHDFKLTPADRRKAKRAVLDAWPGP